uniref:Pseudouridine synthase RsuA/RluA-like domain-containing protein n=1 Tax=Odontella aurita TaxID=265563 RepID=A0A7S4MIQ2_9STRA|mmetsp:Transcript_23016/g.67889  ORF Transcript_23016/g.67889 Transcript_23016/m.67889 type:complete len:436 (+) Transcript_23016:232-1539(+)
MLGPRGTYQGRIPRRASRQRPFPRRTGFEKFVIPRIVRRESCRQIESDRRRRHPPRSSGFTRSDPVIRPSRPDERRVGRDRSSSFQPHRRRGDGSDDRDRESSHGNDDARRPTTAVDSDSDSDVDDRSRRRRRWIRGRADTRIQPGDVVGVQSFTGDYRKRRCYPNLTHGRPDFDLPVVYEDDHLAIVNKPRGVGIYGRRGSRSGKKAGVGRKKSRNNVLAALPFVLCPPRSGTPGGALRRPAPVHRLDTPTSGLLVVAKTKDALRHLYGQFRNRIVKKTYTAVVNGIPQGCDDDHDHDDDDDDRTAGNEWNVIDYPLGGKYAITSWKALRTVDSLHAKDGTLALVRVALHTGRYHQIRRHMARVCRRPLVGDKLYSGGIQARHFRRGGLRLCSSGVILRHPYYDTEEGRTDWDALVEEEGGGNDEKEDRGGGDR